MRYFWMFICDLILPASACFFAYLECYRLAGLALVFGFLVFTVPIVSATDDNILDILKKTIEKSNEDDKKKTHS